MFTTLTLLADPNLATETVNRLADCSMDTPQSSLAMPAPAPPRGAPSPGRSRNCRFHLAIRHCPKSGFFQSQRPKDFPAKIASEIYEMDKETGSLSSRGVCPHHASNGVS